MTYLCIQPQRGSVAARDQNRRTFRPGFTLLEILVVMAVLVIVLALGIAILAAALRVWHAGAEAQNQSNHRRALADRFREDVHQATATPERTDRWTAGPKCLILRRASGGDVVYQYQNGHLERVVLPGAQTQELRCGPEGADVEFLRTGADRRLLTLQLKLPHGKTIRVQSISAALGGDLQ